MALKLEQQTVFCYASSCDTVVYITVSCFLRPDVRIPLRVAFWPRRYTTRSNLPATNPTNIPSTIWIHHPLEMSRIVCSVCRPF